MIKLDLNLQFHKCEAIISLQVKISLPAVCFFPSSYYLLVLNFLQGDRKLIPAPVILPVKRGDVCKLPVRWAKAQVQLDPELARDLVPVEGKNGVGVCSVTGKLSVRDNKFILEVKNFSVLIIANACFKEECSFKTLRIMFKVVFS